MKVSCKKIQLTLELMDADRVTVLERVLLVFPHDAVIAEGEQLSTQECARDGIHTKTAAGIENRGLCKPAETHYQQSGYHAALIWRAVLVCSWSRLFRKNTTNIRSD